jgi:2-keto-4-pentenoate hydratase/2-oxohepta-3-ene-1,7-dioic acid hydratase in catechol pathway
MKSVYLDGDKICPSKIVCIGRNYVDHIKELGNETPSEPVIFLKPNSAISGEIRSNKKDLIHYEAEMTFVVKSGELSAVGFGLDLTKREVQSGLRSKGLPWERSKAFVGSAVFSDFVTFTGPITELRLEVYINDKLVQQGGYELMMNKPQEVLDETKKFLSYEDGDLIMTGTPKGVGPVNADDRFVGKIFENERLLLEHHWVVQ